MSHRESTTEDQSTPNPISQTNWLRNSFRSMTKYWFVLIPAIVINAVLTIDHVVAKNNEKAITVRLSAEALAQIGQDDEKPLTETLRAHWVAANDEGNLDGRISSIDAEQSTSTPIEQLDVTLLQKGQKIRIASTNENGKFVLKDVEPGVYTLVAAGQNGFLAYGVHVLPKLEDFDVLDLDSDATPPATLAEKRAYYVSHFGIPADAIVQEELQIDAACVPPEFSTLQRISRNYLPSATAFGMGTDTDDQQAISKATDILGGFQFPLTAEGNFNGRIQPIATEDGEPAELSDMNMFLVQDDLEVARVAVEKNGKFEIEDVEPGVYSLIAAGTDGFAAMSLELVAKPSDLELGNNQLNSPNNYVSYNAKQAADPAFGVAIVTDPEDIKALQQELDRVAQLRQQAQPPVNQFVNETPFPQDPNGVTYQNAYSSGFGGGYPTGGFPGGSFSGGFADPGFISTPPQGFSSPIASGGPRGPAIRPGNGGRLLLTTLLLAVGVDSLNDEPAVVANPPMQSDNLSVSLQ